MDKESKILSSIYRTILFESIQENHEEDEKILSYVTQSPFNFKIVESPKIVQKNSTERICILAKRKILVPKFIKIIGNGDGFNNSFEDTTPVFNIIKNFERIKFGSDEYRFSGYSIEIPTKIPGRELFLKSCFLYDSKNNKHFEESYTIYNEFEAEKVKEFRVGGINDDDIDTISGMM